MIEVNMNIDKSKGHHLLNKIVNRHMAKRRKQNITLNHEFTRNGLTFSKGN